MPHTISLDDDSIHTKLPPVKLRDCYWPSALLSFCQLLGGKKELETAMKPIDLSSADFIADPFDAYRNLHDRGGLYECPETGYYYVASYDAVREFFKHPAFSADRISALRNALPEQAQKLAQPLLSSLSKWVLFRDPPFHSKIRRVINPAFSGQVVASLTPKIDELTQQLLSNCTDEFDIVEQLAYPLPVMIICELLGVADCDREKIKEWSDALAQFLGERTTPEQILRIQQSIIEASAYFTNIVEQQRTNTTNEVFQQLFNLSIHEPEFTDEYLIANLIALIFAGHETTTNAIANACYALITQPRNWPMDAPRNWLVEAVLEESLRWQSPVQRMTRLLVDDVETPHLRLRKGRRVFLLIGAANRDPQQFPEPDQFDPLRDNASTHVAFGYGPHFCSGAQLARQEIRSSINHFIERFADKQLDVVNAPWRQNIALRGCYPFRVRLNAPR